jgi:hypothetical protein
VSVVGQKFSSVYQFDTENRCEFSPHVPLLFSGQTMLMENCSDTELQEVLKFADVRAICRFKQVCKRFQSKVVTNQLLENIVHCRTNIPVRALKDSPAKLLAELHRIYWKEPFAGFVKKIPNAFQPAPKAFDEEKKGFSGVGFTMLGMDSQFVIQSSMFGEMRLSDERLNEASPAIVRDSQTLQVIGFLPGQQGFVEIFNSKVSGKYAVTSMPTGIFATHIESNLIRSVQELAEVKQSRLTRKCIGNIESTCIDCHDGYFAYGWQNKAHICKLTDEILDFNSPATLEKFISVELPTGALTDMYLDTDMNVIVALCENNRICVINDLEALSSFAVLDYTDRLWPQWKLPAEKRKVTITAANGFLCMISNAGVILVLKWDGKEFIFWKDIEDPTFEELMEKKGVDPDEFFSSMRIQGGFLLVSDATGVGINVWNIAVQSDKVMKKFADQQKKFVSKMDRVVPGMPYWSYSGRKIFFSFVQGALYEYELIQELDTFDFDF